MSKELENAKELLSQAADIGTGDAEYMIEDAKKFYDDIEEIKSGDVCPMALSLALAAQLSHINDDDVYSLGDLIGKIVNHNLYDFAQVISDTA